MSGRLLNSVVLWVHVQNHPQLHLLSEVDEVRVWCKHYENFGQGLNDEKMLGLKYVSINNTISYPHQHVSTNRVFSIE